MPHLLVINRMSAVRRHLLSLLRSQGAWQVDAADSAAAAREHLAGRPADLLVLELALAVADDSSLLRELLADDGRRPVLLTGGDGTVTQVVAALEIGASGFVHHAHLAGDLIANVQRVLAAANRDKCHARLLECMVSSCSGFELDNDPTLIPPLVTRFQASAGLFGVCDAAARTRLGIAVEEALSNALYHGNLEVSSELRREGIDAYYALASQRRAASPYRERRIYITERIDAQEAVFVIRDEGPGFNVEKVNVEPDPEDLEAVSGRGIMLMRAFMDEVVFNAAGNEVTLTKRRGTGDVTESA